MEVYSMVILVGYLLPLGAGYLTCLSNTASEVPMPTCLGSGYPLCWAFMWVPFVCIAKEFAEINDYWIKQKANSLQSKYFRIIDLHWWTLLAYSS